MCVCVCALAPNNLLVTSGSPSAAIVKNHIKPALITNYREWPKPVHLKAMDDDVLNLGLQVWDPRVREPDNQSAEPKL